MIDTFQINGKVENTIVATQYNQILLKNINFNNLRTDSLVEFKDNTNNNEIPILLENIKVNEITGKGNSILFNLKGNITINKSSFYDINFCDSILSVGGSQVNIFESNFDSILRADNIIEFALTNFFTSKILFTNFTNCNALRSVISLPLSGDFFIDTIFVQYCDFPNFIFGNSFAGNQLDFIFSNSKIYDNFLSNFIAITTDMGSIDINSNEFINNTASTSVLNSLIFLLSKSSSVSISQLKFLHNQSK